jgi:hypothetical protein
MMESGEIVFGQFRFLFLGVRKRARLLGINLNTREKQIPHFVRDDTRAWAGGLGGVCPEVLLRNSWDATQQKKTELSKRKRD